MDKNVLLAIIAGIGGLVTSIITSVFAYRKSKDIEKLKRSLDLEKEKLKFILTFETEKVSQFYVCLRSFLATSQKVKDQLRVLYEINTFEKERLIILTKLEEQMIEEYSNNVYFFKSTRPDHAHRLKNSTLELIAKMKASQDTIRSEEFVSGVDEISCSQKLLRERLEIELEKMLASIESKKN